MCTSVYIKHKQERAVRVPILPKLINTLVTGNRKSSSVRKHGREGKKALAIHTVLVFSIQSNIQKYALV